MKDFFDASNKKILNLIKELSDEAKEYTKNAKNEEEEGKITLILLYYKILLQGCINFGKNVSEYVDAIKDCAMDQSDIALVLDKFCGEDAISISLGDIELDENPDIKMDVKEVVNPGDIELDENPPINIKVADVSSSHDIELDFNPRIDMTVADVKNPGDITLDENPDIKMDVKEVVNPGDIELDENPDIKMDVKEVVNPGDIELDENPDIKMDVKEVVNPGDIELDENPDIKMDVKEVVNPGDIELDENPDIKMDVKEVVNPGDIELDQNPDIKIDVKDVEEIDESIFADNEALDKKISQVLGSLDTILDDKDKADAKDDEEKKKSPKDSLFGSLRIDVKDVSEPYEFDAEAFDKQVKAEREAKRKKAEEEKK